MLPRVNIWEEPQRAQLRSRWRQDKARQNIDWWRGYFGKVDQSDFLTGRNGNWLNCNLIWLIGPKNMAKVLNDAYRNRDQSPVIGKTGLSFSGKDQRTANAVEAFKARLSKNGTN